MRSSQNCSMYLFVEVILLGLVRRDWYHVCTKLRILAEHVFRQELFCVVGDNKAWGYFVYMYGVGDIFCYLCRNGRFSFSDKRD